MTGGNHRSDIGKIAEDAAVEYLESIGYEIVERNYRKREGEIDIIALESDTLHFIEVKSRQSSTGLSPAESWSEDQMTRFFGLVDLFISEHPELTGLDVSLDFMGIELSEGGVVMDIEFTPDALRPD